MEEINVEDIEVDDISTYSTRETSGESGDRSSSSISCRDISIVMQEREIFLKAILQLLDQRDAAVDASRTARRAHEISSNSDIIKSGALKKCSGRNILTWKEKYVELSYGMFTYEDDIGWGDCHRKKLIPLTVDTCKCRVIDAGSSEGNWLFELSVTNGRERLWLSNSEAERDAWVQAINTAILGSAGDFHINNENSHAEPKKSGYKSKLLATPHLRQEYMPYTEEIARYENIKLTISKTSSVHEYRRKLSEISPNQLTIPVLYIKETFDGIENGRYKSLFRRPAKPVSSISCSERMATAASKRAALSAQVWKDLPRDVISVNGDVIIGDRGVDAMVGAIVRNVMDQVGKIREQLIVCGGGKFELNEGDALSCVRDVLLACNRTESGGDTYLCIDAMLGNADLVVLSPWDSMEAEPMEIRVDTVRALSQDNQSRNFDCSEYVTSSCTEREHGNAGDSDSTVDPFTHDGYTSDVDVEDPCVLSYSSSLSSTPRHASDKGISESDCNSIFPNTDESPDSTGVENVVSLDGLSLQAMTIRDLRDDTLNISREDDRNTTVVSAGKNFSFSGMSGNPFWVGAVHKDDEKQCEKSNLRPPLRPKSATAPGPLSGLPGANTRMTLKSCRSISDGNTFADRLDVTLNEKKEFLQEKHQSDWHTGPAAVPYEQSKSIATTTTPRRHCWHMFSPSKPLSQQQQQQQQPSIKEGVDDVGLNQAKTRRSPFRIPTLRRKSETSSTQSSSTNGTAVSMWSTATATAPVRVTAKIMDDEDDSLSAMSRKMSIDYSNPATPTAIKSFADCFRDSRQTRQNKDGGGSNASSPTKIKAISDCFRDVRQTRLQRSGSGSGKLELFPPVPSMCIRIQVRVRSRYRLCAADPQDELTDTWASVTGCLHQLFFIKANCNGRPAVSDRLVTIVIGNE